MRPWLGYTVRTMWTGVIAGSHFHNTGLTYHCCLSYCCIFHSPGWPAHVISPWYGLRSTCGTSVYSKEYTSPILLVTSSYVYTKLNYLSYKYIQPIPPWNSVPQCFNYKTDGVSDAKLFLTQSSICSVGATIRNVIQVSTRKGFTSSIS
jgi:hypothetical protein